jgi:hypothetical protein
MNYLEVVGQNATRALQLAAVLSVAVSSSSPSQPPPGFYVLRQKPTAAQVMPSRAAEVHGAATQVARTAVQELSVAISTVATEARYDNWDGEHARAISRETVRVADRFAALLPAGLPLPEVSATPRGWMEFEWTKDDRTVFVIRVREGEKLAYAGLFSDAHGEEIEAIGSLPMPTERLREPLLSHLREANGSIAT